MKFKFEVEMGSVCAFICFQLIFWNVAKFVEGASIIWNKKCE